MSHLRSRPARRVQNAKHLMPTAAKKAWISALAAAGIEGDRGRFLRAAQAHSGDGGHRRDRRPARTIPGLTVVALAPT